MSPGSACCRSTRSRSSRSVITAPSVGQMTPHPSRHNPPGVIGGEMSAEWFQFLAYRWDVTAARQIAADLPVHQFDPTFWFGWLGAIVLDEDHVAVVDLTRPVIAVRLAAADGAPMGPFRHGPQRRSPRR